MQVQFLSVVEELENNINNLFGNLKKINYER